jgi:hypothetical protein
MIYLYYTEIRLILPYRPLPGPQHLLLEGRLLMERRDLCMPHQVIRFVSTISVSPPGSSQLDLLRLNTGAPSRVVTACTILKRMLFRYQGHISAALVLGGVDISGAHLYQVKTCAPHQF